MKSKMYVFVAVVLMAAMAPAWADVATDGLQVHYRADNADGAGNPGSGNLSRWTDLATEDGKSNNGSLRAFLFQAGSGWVENTDQPENSPFRYGLEFEATDNSDGDYVRVTPPAFQDQDSFTYEFWMKPDTLSYSGSMLLITENKHDRKICKNMLTTSLDGHVHSLQSPRNGAASWLTGEAFRPVGQFVQLVVTKSGDDVWFYINGGFTQGQTANVKSDGNYDGPEPTEQNIGIYNTSDGRIYNAFSGQMNIVRIYNRPLTAQEVAGNYAAEMGLPAPKGLSVAGDADPKKRTVSPPDDRTATEASKLLKAAAEGHAGARRVRTLVAQAEAHAAGGRQDEALACLDRAENGAPDDTLRAAVLLRKAALLREQGLPDVAVIACRKILDGGAPDTVKAEALWHIGETYRLEQTEPETRLALKAYDELMSRYPRARQVGQARRRIAELQLGRGEALLGRKSLEALKAFDAVAAKAPNSALSRRAVGCVFELFLATQPDLESAKKECKAWGDKALGQIDRAYLPLAIGQSLYRSRRYKEAAEHLGALVAEQNKSPYVPGALSLLGMCCTRDNRPKDALKAFAALVEKHPKSPEAPRAQYLIGWVNVFEGQTQEGIAAFKKVIANYPKSEYAGRAAEYIQRTREGTR